MCILIGKWFPNWGWVAVKNRDRNYIPEISFQKRHVRDTEILYFWDDITQYCEGFNSVGIGILSASLMVLDDEKEIDKRTDQPSPDGKKIKKALRETDIQDAVAVCVAQKLPGNTLIFNSDHMYLLEGAWRPGEYLSKGYVHKVREIPRSQTVVRTNHGILLPWAGYQRGISQNQDLSRISSESRRLIAQYVADTAHDPESLLDLLTVDHTGDGQLNALRTTTARKKMRTTSQIMIIPKEKTMYVRPVQSHMSFNFWKLNHPSQKTWVELLSNRVLYMNLKHVDLQDEPPFLKNLNHNSK